MLFSNKCSNKTNQTSLTFFCFVRFSTRFGWIQWPKYIYFRIPMTERLTGILSMEINNYHLMPHMPPQNPSWCVITLKWCTTNSGCGNSIKGKWPKITAQWPVKDAGPTHLMLGTTNAHRTGHANYRRFNSTCKSNALHDFNGGMMAIVKELKIHSFAFNLFHFRARFSTRNGIVMKIHHFQHFPFTFRIWSLFTYQITSKPSLVSVTYSNRNL